MERSMRATLKRISQAVATPRALERQTLHELDDGRLVLEHLSADHRPLQFEDTTARPDDLYRKRFLKEAVDQCVEQLPTHHRAVFVLRELEGKSYAEIADITGCNLGTVKSRLNRARNSFAQLIGPLLQ